MELTQTELSYEDINLSGPEEDTEGDGEHLIFTPLPCRKIRTSVLDDDGEELVVGYDWPPDYTPVETNIDRPVESRPFALQPEFFATVAHADRGGGEDDEHGL